MAGPSFVVHGEHVELSSSSYDRSKLLQRVRNDAATADKAANDQCDNAIELPAQIERQHLEAWQSNSDFENSDLATLLGVVRVRLGHKCSMPLLH